MSDPHWDDHADWWQREFTDGADPEYVEQIIPLALEFTDGFERVLDVGAEKVKSLAVMARSAYLRWSASTRPGARSRSGVTRRRAGACAVGV